MNRFEFLRKLGKGSFGSVFLVRERKTQEEKVMKVMRKEYKTAWKRNEVQVHRKVSPHENIIQFFESFETASSYICIVMAFAQGGELFQLLQKNFLQFSFEKKLQILKELIAGLQHCHSKGIVHMDLKLENVLLDAQGHVKLADFGCAITLTLNQRYKASKAQPGNDFSKAPEVRKGELFDQRADVWALGTLIFELFHRVNPDGDDIFNDADDEASILLQLEKFSLPPLIYSLLKSIFIHDPLQRPFLERVSEML